MAHDDTLRLVAASVEDSSWIEQLRSIALGETLPDLPEPHRSQLLAMQLRAQSDQYQAQWPGAGYLLLMRDETRIGYLLLDEDSDEIRLVDIALLPACRNRGLGATALRKLQERARAAGQAVALTVIKGNPAHHLYLRLGFEAIAESATHIEMVWAAGERHEADAGGAANT